MSHERQDALAQELLDDLCARFPMAYRPALAWKSLRVSAGIAYYARGAIALSRLILTDENRLRETLIHEYAHLLAVHRHGRAGAGHGAAWREAMREMGAEPVVRHSYDVARNAPKQEVGYLCLRCGRTLVRRRRLPRRRKYVHADCGGGLKLAFVRKATGSPTAA